MTIQNIAGVWWVLNRRTLYLARDKELSRALAQALRNVYSEHKAIHAIDDLKELDVLFSGMKRVRAFCGRMTPAGTFYGVVKNV